MLAVLASALASRGVAAALSSRQLAAAASALASLGAYHEPALLALCKAAARALPHWEAGAAVSLLRSLEALRFRDEHALRGAVRALSRAAEQRRLSDSDAGDALAALLQLAFASERLEALLLPVCRCVRVSVLRACPCELHACTRDDSMSTAAGAAASRPATTGTCALRWTSKLAAAAAAAAGPPCRPAPP
jgi:hypothetical protein